MCVPGVPHGTAMPSGFKSNLRFSILENENF